MGTGCWGGAASLARDSHRCRLASWGYEWEEQARPVWEQILHLFRGSSCHCSQAKPSSRC